VRAERVEVIEVKPESGYCLFVRFQVASRQVHPTRVSKPAIPPTPLPPSDITRAPLNIRHPGSPIAIHRAMGPGSRFVFCVCFFTIIGWTQDQPPSSQDRDRTAPPDPVTQQPQPPPAQPEYKRIFGIIPNYRSVPTTANYQPLTTREKFKIFAKDSFDRGDIVLAAGFAGQGQLSNSNRSFGQGAAGYARYFGTAYADIVIGNFWSEAVFPSMLHHDPRYFRRGTGTGWSRLGYAVKQIFWTHTDSGGHAFNLSEWGGNAVASGISLAYYPDNRTGSEFASKLGIAVGLDTTGNILKEFWPDIAQKFGRKKHTQTTP
jgi:hypothetical protein